MTELPVVYVKDGVANRYHDRIELNVNLLRYPELHDYVLAHEKRHTDKAWSLDDLKNDMTSTKYSMQLITFTLKYGRRDLLPVYKTKEKWYIDYSLLFIYSLIMGVIVWLLM